MKLSPRMRTALRVGFVILVLAFGSLAIANRWTDVRASAVRLSWPVLLGAFVLGLGNILAAGISWRILLADLGSPLAWGASMRVFFVSQLGKYVPGSVWPLLAQAELGGDHGVPRRRSVVIGMVAMGVSLATGLVVATATLPFAAPGAARRYLWVLLALPVLLAALHPGILHRLATFGLQVLRRPPLERPLTFRALGLAFGVQLIGWMLVGVQVYVLAVALGAPPGRALPLCVGGVALAWSAGLLALPVPAGVGVREVILGLTLAPVLDAGSVVVVVVLSRLLTTLGDGFWAGVGVLAHKRARRVPLAPSEKSGIN